MLELTIVGLDALRAKLDKLEAALDVEEILDEAEALMLNRIRARFLAETDPDGVKWIPSKRALKTGGKTLFKTGTLFHSIQAHATGPNERSIGTNVMYGPFHQFGTFKLPRRIFLGFSEEDLFITERRITQRVMEALA